MIKAEGDYEIDYAKSDKTVCQLTQENIIEVTRLQEYPFVTICFNFLFLGRVENVFY